MHVWERPPNNGYGFPEALSLLRMRITIGRRRGSSAQCGNFRGESVGPRLACAGVAVSIVSHSLSFVPCFNPSRPLFSHKYGVRRIM